MADTIFIRNTEGRRAQLTAIAGHTGREGDTDVIDFALSYTLAALEAAKSRVIITGLEQRTDSLAAVPDVEAAALALVDGALSGVVTQQEARQRVVELMRLARCKALADWTECEDDRS